MSNYSVNYFEKNEPIHTDFLSQKKMKKYLRRLVDSGEVELMSEDQIKNSLKHILVDSNEEYEYHSDARSFLL